MTDALSARVVREPSAAPGRRLRVALAGTGMIAAVHRRAVILAGAELVGVLGSRPERSRQAARRWGLPAAFTSLAELAASPADVVHVCTPNATHAPYVEALLAAGKHVVCEKPLGVSLAEAERMNALAQQAGVVATVPFVYRYDPVVREIRARALAGRYGQWNLLHGHYLQDWLLSSSASSWRVDPARGGPSRASADIGSHWCDLVEWVSGERLDTLTAQFSVAVPERPTSPDGPSGDGRRAAVRTEDIATVLFRSATGVPGSMLVSQVAAGRKNRLWLELDGSAGSAVFDQENPESFWTGTAEGSQVFVRSSDSGSAEQRRLSYLPAGHAQGYGDCFAAFVADTYAAISGEQPDGLPTFADGLRSARIVDAVVRSAADSTWTKVERIAAVAGAITAEGVTPCFHPHVGSWIETEHEVRALLDSVDASILSFGPDTGHLFWAGMNPAAVIAGYAPRVRAVHLKDVHRLAAAHVREQGDDYMEATVIRHVWTEPGRGDVDFGAVFAALPSSYQGWFVVEVDVPDLPTKEESTAHSARWILAQPERVACA